MTRDQYTVLGIIYVESPKDKGKLTPESIILREIWSNEAYDRATRGLHEGGFIEPRMRNGELHWRLRSTR